MTSLKLGFNFLLFLITELLIFSEQYHYYNARKIIFIFRCTELNSNIYIAYYISIVYGLDVSVYPSPFYGNTRAPYRQ
jgi:hypothetical protein